MQKDIGQQAKSILSASWRGLLVCALVALAARFLADHYGAPVMLMALLLGMALNFLSAQDACQPGIDFASRQVLRWGVALLGLRVGLDQLMALGWDTALMVLLSVPATIGLGLLVSRFLGIRPALGLVTGGAVGICGASAALALASCLPRDTHRERDLGWTVMGVSILSTLAMLIYPPLAKMLSLSATQTGVFLGASIHDVAQVVGAGYSVSSSSGDTAVLTKLMRVAMLVPVMVMVTLIVSYNTRQRDGDRTDAPPDTPILPGFAVAFIALALLQAALKLPSSFLALGQSCSQWALTLAMAAIGLKAQLAQWHAMGWRPVLLLVIETLFLALLVLIWLTCMPAARMT